MTHKKIKSLTKFNILLVLFFVFGGIGALAFSTEVLSFENGGVFSAEYGVFGGESETPGGEEKPAENKNAEQSPDGADGRLAFGQFYAEFIKVRPDKGKKDAVPGKTVNSTDGGSVNYNLEPRILAREPNSSSTNTELTKIKEIEPSISPDGTKIVFISYRDHDFPNYYEDREREIYIMNADGTSQRRLTFNDDAESMPTFSPDGTKIVYIGSTSSDKYTFPGIYTMNLDGSNQTLVVGESFSTQVCEGAFSDPKGKTKDKTEGGEADFYYDPTLLRFTSPNFSLDNSKILFGYGNKAYTINPDGTGCSSFYEQSYSYYSRIEPQYSPDGTKIVLVDITGEYPYDYSLKIFDNNGLLLNTITPIQIPYSPKWSPDGTKIAYISSPENINAPQIVTTNLDGTNQTVVYAPQEQNFAVPQFAGLSWGNDPPNAPLISLEINDPHPVSGGNSTTGKVNLDPSLVTPGGATVLLSVADGSTAISLPQTSVVVPAGQTSATFPIDTAFTQIYASGDIIATIGANTTRATVSISPSKPDLEAVNFVVPSTVSINQPTSVSFTVKNISQINTTRSTYDYIFFSTDNQLDDYDSYISYNTSAPLAAQAQRTTTRNITIPANVVPQDGTYYLIFSANNYRELDEGGSYANNVIVKPVQISLPDIVAENVNVPAEIEPNVYYNITWNARNAGTVTTGTGFSTDVYYSSDDVAGNSDDLYIGYTYTSSPLAPNESVAQNVYIRIPTLPVRDSGAAFVYLRLDSGNQVGEGTPDGAGETNNFVFKQTQFEYRVPDLQITATNSPPNVDSDTEFALGWTTTNAGNKTTGEFSDKVYFSPDNQVGDDVEIGSFALPSGITAGQSVQRIQNVTIPTGAITQTGNYFVYINADGANEIDEGEREDNNVKFQPVFVHRLLRPDLVVSNITIPNQAFFDQTINVQWTVTNNGQGPTNVPQWTDSIYLSPQSTFNGTGHIRDVSSSTALNPGESYIASVPIKIPRGYAGEYTFFIKTDSYSAVNEEDRTNNVLSRQIQFNVPPLPDLVVTNVQSPAQAFAGQSVEFTYTVANQGTGGSTGGNFRKDQVFLSRDTILDGNDRLIFTSDEKSGINPNGTQTLTTQRLIPRSNPPQYYPLTLPSDLSGEYYVFVVADAYDQVYEYTNENNNSNYDRTQPGSPINILITPPDLVIENQPTAPANGISGQNVAVSFTIKNQGAFNTSANTSNGWNDSVYLSDDATFDATDVLIGSKNRRENLAGGAEYLVETSVRLPDCLRIGTHYLIAVADSNKQVSEFDSKLDAEANNASPAKAIQINTVPPDLQVTNLQHSAITQPGQSVTVNYTVSNNGTGAANGNWNDRIILYSNTQGIVPVQIGYVEHQGGLAVGASYSVTQNVGLPQYMQGE